MQIRFRRNTRFPTSQQRFQPLRRNRIQRGTELHSNICRVAGDQAHPLDPPLSQIEIHEAGQRGLDVVFMILSGIEGDGMND
jgi:hypothetical protein